MKKKKVNPEQENASRLRTTYKKMWPRIRDTLPYARKEGERGGEENSATTSEHLVQRISNPTPENGATKLSPEC